MELPQGDVQKLALVTGQDVRLLSSRLTLFEGRVGRLIACTCHTARGDALVIDTSRTFHWTPACAGATISEIRLPASAP